MHACSQLTAKILCRARIFFLNGRMFTSPYLERRTRRELEIGMRRQNLFHHQNSETARRNQSGHNPDMEVMDSIIGQKVVRARRVQKQED